MKRVLVAAAVVVGALGAGATSASAGPVPNGHNCNGAATSAGLPGGGNLGTYISGVAQDGLGDDFATGSVYLGDFEYGANCGNNEGQNA